MTRRGPELGAAEPTEATLADVASGVGGAVVGEPGTRVSDVFQDSRRTRPGALFAVRKGQRSDGRAFVADAIARGATALLVDDAELARSAGVPAVLVADVREALGPAALVVHGFPDRRLRVVGVTGTNGKTTTTQLVGSMLEAQGARPAVLGTLGCRFDGQEEAGTHTTPEADDLVRQMAGLLARGASHLVMEVSSHALALGRVGGVRFEAAGFTNLTHDHLDFHGTMEAYGEAKARLFTAFSPATSVLNADDPFGDALARRASGRVLAVSHRGAPGASLLAGRAAVDAAGLRALVRLPDGGEVELRSPLVGAHNLENLLVALGLGLGLGLAPADAARGLAAAPPVAGRLERCSGPEDDVLVLVDYAHTPDALARVLSALRPLCRGKLRCVFGCGGDRDGRKRGPMGEAAARGADVLIVTNDNPRTESPEAIAEAVVAGVHRAGARCAVVLDRSAAIEQAVTEAEPGDVVLVAGKGHEPYQIIDGVSRPFDDRAEARRALALRRR